MHTKISKYLSLILRHKPEELGIQLNDNGWTDIEILLDKINNNTDFNITFRLLKEVVDNNDKKRFDISEDGKKIRANQGLSVDIDLELIEAIPPRYLYHGTADRFVPSIREEGLKKMSRQYVHLSDNIESAETIGRRYGKVNILIIDTQAMRQDGYKFYQSKNSIWLIDFVPSKYIVNFH